VEYLYHELDTVLELYVVKKFER